MITRVKSGHDLGVDEGACNRNRLTFISRSLSYDPGSGLAEVLALGFRAALVLSRLDQWPCLFVSHNVSVL
jgi:hypothetical protein